MELKPGARLRSQVSDVTVVVVAAVAGDVVVSCGGSPMLPIDHMSEPVGGVAVDGTTLLGKRYVAPDARLEVLCTKGGAGTLTCDGEAMVVKDAKALPSSD